MSERKKIHLFLQKAAQAVSEHNPQSPGSNAARNIETFAIFLN